MSSLSKGGADAVNGGLAGVRFELVAALSLLVSHQGCGVFSLVTRGHAAMTGRHWRNKSSGW
jgi:hypothetical protein